MAGAGFGAIAIIFWEVAEYLVMRSGVAGLDLTYADTLADLVLSTTGGALGSFLAVRFDRRTQPVSGSGRSSPPWRDRVTAA